MNLAGFASIRNAQTPKASDGSRKAEEHESDYSCSEPNVEPDVS